MFRINSKKTKIAMAGNNEMISNIHIKIISDKLQQVKQLQILGKRRRGSPKKPYSDIKHRLLNSKY